MANKKEYKVNKKDYELLKDIKEEINHVKKDNIPYGIEVNKKCYIISKIEKYNELMNRALKGDDKSKIEKAKCPNWKCEKLLKWDWCHDTYIVDNDHCTEVEIISNGLKDEEKLTVYVCTCGRILAIGVHSEEGYLIYNHPDLEGIDWEDDINSHG